MDIAAVVTKEERHIEVLKYRSCYADKSYNYAMGGLRMQDAIADLKWAHSIGCRDMLDIGCGRGEMLKHAENIGFESAHGTEVVPELQNDHVFPAYAHEIADLFGNGSIDLVTSFDVIEHLHPGDDVALLENMAKVARKAMAITANNRRSIDPSTGNDLHINKRPYDEWDSIIREAWSGWNVQRMTDKRYVSETWRATRDVDIRTE